MSEFEFLGPAIAVVALFAVVALAVQVVRLGRQVRRLTERIESGGPVGEAERLSLSRLRDIGAQVDSEPGAPRRTTRIALIAGAVALLVLVAAGGGFLILRDDGGDGGTPTEAVNDPPPAPPVSTPDPGTTVPTAPEVLGDKSAFTVLVLNASGVDGAAGQKIKPLLETFGYTVPPAQDAPSSDFEESVVMFAPGQRVLAENVAADLEITDIAPQDGLDLRGADAAVLVGLDLANRP